jgi:hypothetical protein
MQYKILFTIIIIILYIYFIKIGFKEGFTWSKQSIHDFLILQTTVNPQVQFDMQMVQEQASEDELKNLFKTGYWPWSEETKYSYMDQVAHNPIININPAYSMEYVRKIYNEKAAKQLISWNTKEGKFLLNGVKIDNGIITCNTDDNGNVKMKKTIQNGYNLWNGYKNSKETDIPNDSIPNEIQGFQFIKNSCNPCIALNNDYSCPFQIDIEGDTGISSIWKNLWNI